ncbi:hypothetical protein K0U00_31330, partial [Paenibacillus sepulcri]|nr:hypothetical protein [Paenibacillus sepulcri]
AFKPSPRCPGPRTIVTVGFVCADTEEEARELAAAGMSLFQSNISTEELAALAARKLLAGTPEALTMRLEEMSLQYGVDEFMLVTMIPDYRKRLRSFELLARSMWSSGGLQTQDKERGGFNGR